MKEFIARHNDGTETRHATLPAAEDALRPRGGEVWCTCCPSAPMALTTIVASPRPWLVELATAMQESTLRSGDRGSLGLFQQRES